MQKYKKMVSTMQQTHVDHEPWTADRGPQTADLRPQTADRGPRTYTKVVGGRLEEPIAGWH